jgi:sugar phosphate isomerase/epimerase
MSPRLELSRLSLNQITVEQWSLPEVIDACGRAGLTMIGPWRHKVAEVGVDDAARRIREAGLRVSSLCRGGFFPAADGAGRAASDADNRRAVEEAAALGTDVLVLVCGPPLGRDVEGARAQILAGIERLVPHAEQHGVRLAIEPLHPMMISERSAIVTLGEANDLAERFDAHRVGVVVDAYHVWWDPRLYEEIARAGRRILGYHVADWLVPTTDRLQGRGMMGDGVIELKRIRAAVEDAGYDGPIEVEVINREAWARPGDELVAEVCDAFLRAA